MILFQELNYQVAVDIELFVCEKGLGACHQITRTLCMTGVMRDKEYLTGDLCKGVYSDEEYKNDFINVIRNQYYTNKNSK